MKKHSLDTLPSEVLLHIFSYVRSQTDLWSCLFVSKRLSLHAQEALWSEPFLNSERDFHLWVASLWKIPILVNAQYRISSPDLLDETRAVYSQYTIDPLLYSDVPMVDRDSASRRISISELNQNVVKKSRTRSSTVGNFWMTMNSLTSSKRPPTPPHSNYENTLTFGKYIKNLYLDSEVIRPHINDATLNRILLATGKRLRRLDLSGCDGLGDRAFEIFAFSRRLSKYVVQSSMPCENLQAISLQGCIFVTPEALKRLFKLTHKLKILNLNRVSSVDNSVLHVIGENCKALRGLSLNSCYNITDEGIISVFAMRNTRDPSPLRELSLCDCVNLSDVSIQVVAENSPSLCYLRLTGCKKISDRSLCSIVSNCRELQYLFLARCAISNAILQRFKVLADAGFESKLEYIDLAYASELTLSVFMDMVYSCKHLVSIGLGACHGIIRHDFVKSLSESPRDDLPAHIRDSYCVFRGKESISQLKRRYLELTDNRFQ